MLTTASLLVRLHLRRLWAQRLRTVLAVGAVAAGTSLAVGVVIVVSSTTTSVTAFGRQVEAVAPLRVVGATPVAGLPSTVARRVATTPGVAAAVPVVQASSVVRTADGGDAPVVVVGAGCGAARLIGLAGCAGGAAGPPIVLVGTDLARHLGPRSWLQTDFGVLPLTGSLPLPALDRLVAGQVVVTGLTRAQALFDRGGRVDVVYVELTRGASVGAVQARLAARLGPAFAVLRPGQPPAAVTLATSEFVPLLSVVAAVAAVIAAILVYDVVALTLEERRRQQAVLAAVGAPPWLLAAGPAVESAAMGAVGGLLGVAGGTALARPVLAPLSAFSAGLFGVPVTVHVAAADVGLGVAFGVAVGLAAAVRPVLRTSRLDVAAELSQRQRRADTAPSSAWRRTALGGLGLVAASALAYAGSRHGALAPWQRPTAEGGFLLAIVAGSVVVGAAAVLPFLAVAGRQAGQDRRVPGGGGRRAAGDGRPGPARRFGPPPALRVARAAASREPGRVGIMAVAVAAAVAVGTMTGGYTQGLTAAFTAGLARSAHGRGVVVGTIAGTSGFDLDAHLPAQVVSEVAAVPQVARLDEFVAVLSGSTPGSLAEVEAATGPGGGPALLAGTARRAPFDRGAVMVGAGLARDRHLVPGGTVRLDTPGGVAALRVEGVWDDGDVNGANVTMTPGQLRRLFGPQLAGSVTAVPRPGTTPAQLDAYLRHLPLPPDVTITAPAAFGRHQVGEATSQLAPFWTLERALLGVAFVGVLATLLLVGVGRRREVAVLEAVGMTPAGVFQLVVSEAVAVAAVGAVGGVAFGAVLLALLLVVAPLVIGFTVPYRFDAAVLVTVVPLALALSAAAAVLPAWQAARAPVVDGLRQE